MPEGVTFEDPHWDGGCSSRMRGGVVNGFFPAPTSLSSFFHHAKGFAPVASLDRDDQVWDGHRSRRCWSYAAHPPSPRFVFRSCWKRLPPPAYRRVRSVPPLFIWSRWMGNWIPSNARY